MANTLSQTTLSPHNQTPLCTRIYPTEAELDEKLQNAARAQEAWKQIDLKERIAVGYKFMVRAEYRHSEARIHADADAFSRKSLKK